MKFRILFFALLFSAGLNAQTQADYQLDDIRSDSFYIVERVSAIPTPENPRPQTLTSYQLFRSIADFWAFVDGFTTQAEKARKEAEEKVNEAKRLDEMAEKMRVLANDNKQFLGKKPTKKANP
jgi:hypothetical protein